MAPHLTAAELDYIFQLDRAGRRPVEIHASLVSKRARRGIAAPTLARFRAALRGTTYKRSRKETRGRKQKLSRHAVLKMNQTRKQLVQKAQGQREVRWVDIRKAARVPRVHRTTLKRSFAREGLQVQARRPRLKLARTPQQAAKRVEYCKKWCNKPQSFFCGRAGSHHRQQEV